MIYLYHLRIVEATDLLCPFSLAKTNPSCYLPDPSCVVVADPRRCQQIHEHVTMRTHILRHRYECNGEVMMVQWPPYISILDMRQGAVSPKLKLAP